MKEETIHFRHINRTVDVRFEPDPEEGGKPEHTVSFGVAGEAWAIRWYDNLDTAKAAYEMAVQAMRTAAALVPHPMPNQD